MTIRPIAKHIDSIDGLRGLSIVFVIFSHAAGMLPAIFRHGTQLGPAGVTIFFVISGYLITSKLLAEKARSGKISLRNFILGRIFRLMPASMCLIVTAVILSHLGIVKLSGKELIHALTYTMDYIHPANATLEHLWSLSVEEQFYLIWPIALLIAGDRKSTAACVIVLLLCPIMRGLAWYTGDVDHLLVFRRFEFLSDALAIGCLLSLVQGRLPKWISSSATSIICILVIILDCMAVRHWQPFPIIGITINSICSALIINCLVNPNLAISRHFAWAPLKWVGTVSYSLYLWQQMFLMPPYPAVPSLWMLALKCLGALAVATISYYGIERPIRDWGKRLYSRPSTPKVDLSAEPSLANG
jgi:peptidoglycan/LPS O-acetylase OafA/YrhL